MEETKNVKLKNNKVFINGIQVGYIDGDCYVHEQYRTKSKEQGYLFEFMEFNNLSQMYPIDLTEKIKKEYDKQYRLASEKDEAEV